jgi:hypothetical protein
VIHFASPEFWLRASDWLRSRRAPDKKNNDET